MKKVIAMIKPFKLADVVEALQAHPLQGVSAVEVRGFGIQKGHLDLYTGSEYKIKYLPKTRLEFFVEAADLEPVLQALIRAAKTGRIGDGKILVLDAAVAPAVVSPS